MTDTIPLTIEAIDTHRNAVGGNGFFVAVFRFRDGKATRRMVGIVFEEPGSCAVLEIRQLAEGNIAFAMGNSWRGDHFETQLREAYEIESERRFGK